MNKGMPNRYKPAWRKGQKPLPPSRKVGQAIKKGPSRTPNSGRKG
jgi:hypothetical protein